MGYQDKGPVDLKSLASYPYPLSTPYLNTASWEIPAPRRQSVISKSHIAETTRYADTQYEAIHASFHDFGIPALWSDIWRPHIHFEKQTIVERMIN